MGIPKIFRSPKSIAVAGAIVNSITKYYGEDLVTKKGDELLKKITEIIEILEPKN